MEEKAMPKLSAGFCLTSDAASLEDITRVLEIVPSKTKKKGEWHQGTIDAGLACDMWKIENSAEVGISVSGSCRQLISKLQGKEKSIKYLCEKYNMESQFQVVIHMNVSNVPEFTLEREVIQFLASINASIDVDIYSY